MSAANKGFLDEAAFEGLFKESFVPLCSYCQYKFSFDLDTAKEVVHNGFLKLWEHRNTLSPTQSAASYLHTIITNNSLDFIRHEKVKQKHVRFILQKPEVFQQAISENGPDLKNLSAAIDEAVAELPEQMRRVFELSRYEGLKYAEVAQELSISVKTVETQMSRALARLRQQLARYLVILILLSFF